MRNRTQAIFTVLLLAAITTPARAQTDDFWRNRWFWGVQGGTYLFNSGGSTEIGAGAGGHWFITAGRSALLMSFDQIFMTDATSTLGNGTEVGFSSMQRVQASVVAMPSLASLNLFVGGGFSIHHITNAVPTGVFTTPQTLSAAQDAVDDVSTKAFFVMTVGAQKRWKDRWVLFAQYQFMPPANDFLITSAQHSFSGGLRFSLTTSKTAVTTGR